ncbi:MAG: hypothetical protein AABX04_07320 [Nanoarchaeota archaeon]
MTLLGDARYLPYERNHGEDNFYVRCDGEGRIVVLSPRDLFKNEIRPAAEVEKKAELSCLVLSTPEGVEELVGDYHVLQELKEAEESFQPETPSYTDSPTFRKMVKVGLGIFPERMAAVMANSSRFRKFLGGGMSGVVGYTVGAVGGAVTAAVITDGSIFYTFVGAGVGNKIGTAPIAGLHLYQGLKLKFKRKNREALQVEYQEALTQFQEKYASRAVLDREGLLLAVDGIGTIL